MALTTRITLLDRIRDPAETRSWSDFVAVYGPLVERWLRHEGVQPTDAEDVRQEVMTFLVGEIGRFQHNGRTGAFRRWLRLVTANRLREFLRKRRRDDIHLAELANQLEDDRSRASVLWDSEHDRRVLDGMLGRLESRFGADRVEAFRRLVLEETTAEVLAGELGITIGAVRVMQHRILRALRELTDGLVD